METLTCPACGKPLEVAGRTERCASCHGAWIHEDVLVGILQEATSALVFLPWHARPSEGHRNCAVCAAPMEPVSLGNVPLDRCAKHGVWFDAKELAEVIEHAKELRAELKGERSGDGKHHGMLGAIARLFGT